MQKRKVLSLEWKDKVGDGKLIIIRIGLTVSGITNEL